MGKVGKNGVVTVSEGQEAGIKLELSKGMKFERGYLSPFMITDSENMLAKYENVRVMVTDRRISTLKHIQPLLEQMKNLGENNLVIICDDIVDEALPQLVKFKLNGIFNILAIRAP